MKLVANECVQCRRPVGYVTPEAYQIPTLCVLCCFDKDTLEEWGHTVDPKEKKPSEVLAGLRTDLNRLDLK